MDNSIGDGGCVMTKDEQNRISDLSNKLDSVITDLKAGRKKNIASQKKINERLSRIENILTLGDGAKRMLLFLCKLIAGLVALWGAVVVALKNMGN